MTAIPKNIERKHIIQAINEIHSKRSDKIPISESLKYDLIHNAKRYPPKYVLSLANMFANGEELKGFNSNEANNFFKRLDFEDIKIVKKEKEDNDKTVNVEVLMHPKYEKILTPDEIPAEIDRIAENFIDTHMDMFKKTIPTDNISEKESIIFPELNENLSIEELAQIYCDIEKGKNVNPPIHIPTDCNVIPASIRTECKDKLVGIIIDKRDFERRMPEILAHHIRCKHKRVILAVYYWDTHAWEITWKKPFEAVGGEVQIQMPYEGLPKKILKTKEEGEKTETEDFPICPFCRTKQKKIPDDIEDFEMADVYCSQCKQLFVTILNRESKTFESFLPHSNGGYDFIGITLPEGVGFACICHYQNYLFDKY